MNESFQVASERLRYQYHHLDNLANNQANAATPGFVAQDSGCRQGEFASWMRQRQGAIANTDRAMDVALPAGSYFQIQTPQGTRLTRRGDLHLDEQKQLVVGDGWPVLGETGSPIVVQDSAIRVAPDGTIYDQGTAVGRLARVRVDAVEGQSNWLQAAPGAKSTADNRELTSSQLESSNVDVAEEQTNLVALLRRAQALSNVMQVQDQSLDKAIREIGRGR